MTAERICEIWMSVQGESLGPAIRLGAGLRDVLVVYPPLHPFALLRLRLRLRGLPGELALWRLSEAHAGFAEAYFEMLKAGGTKHHSELLKPFGLDAHDPAFWQAGSR